MRHLRKRLTYANVMSSIAVFLLLGGAAVAATQLPTNSVGTKQIKKNAVIGSKVKNGSLKAADFKTGQLPAGPKGATGAQGPKGDIGPKGDRGEPGPLVETLPSGKTERGFYDYAGTRASGGSKFVPVFPISFTPPLSTMPTAETLAPGGPPTATCPGNVEEPKATAGHLCLYERTNTGGPAQIFINTEIGRHGAELYTNVAEGANYEIAGTWAVTAP